MASTKDLNIRLGLIFDERSLAKVENQLRRSGEKLSRLGDALTLSVSAPLAALGAGSIKAAGDLQSLTLALESQLGSAEAAKKELDALTEAAKNPGLGVEQAVKGSVRLQGVGFAAEEARGVLVELGNALASTGGTAEDLDRVSRQFAQMTSKGKVLQEDISVISESMPGIAQLMQKAFGTGNVEAIREMGIGGKEFVLAITNAAKELPRVEGGIKNSIGNALDSIKQSAARVGEAINNAFDIAGTAEAFGSTLVGLANGFSNLNPAIQQFVVYLGAALVAAGPLAKVFGSIQLLSSQMVGIFSGVSSALRGLSAWVATTTTAFNALNLATRAFIVIGLVTAIASLAYNFGAFNRELTANEKAQSAVNNLELEAKKTIAGEKAEVDRLIAVINSEVTSRDAKARAIENLKKISPQYFGQLKEENGLVIGLESSYQSYIAALLQSAKAAAAREKLVEIERQLLDIEDKRLEKVNEAAKVSAFFTGSTQSGLKREKELYAEQVSELSLKRDALTKVLVANEQVNASTQKSIAISPSDVKATRDKTAAIKEQAEVIEKAGSIANFDQIPTLPTPGSVTSESSGSQGGPKTVDTSSLQQYLTFAEQLGEVNLQFQESAIGFNEAFAQSAKLVQEQGTMMQQVMFGVADAVSQASASGAASFKELAGAAVGAAAKVVRSWIQQGVAAAVAKALSSLPFPANLAAGALAGGLASAAFTKAISAIGVPKFARGTGFASGGLSLVGEQGPELMNVPRGAQILSNQKTNSFLNERNSGQMSGEFTVRGTDLVLILDRVQAKQNRAN